MNIPQKRVICVIGMHRSGTSALTRGLQVLGVDLGDKLLPPGSDNKRGYWEDYEIQQFNDSLLKKLGSKVLSLNSLDHAYLNESCISEEKVEAYDLLRKKFESINLFAFKDPRTTILLNFWQSIFKKMKLNESYLFSIRNPLNIANSLFKRNEIPIYKGLLLWFKYISSGILDTENKNVLFLKFENLLNDPFIQIKRISNYLELDLLSDFELKFDEYKNNFLTLDLYHNKESEELFFSSKEVPSYMKEVYKKLSSLSNSSGNAADIIRSDLINDIIEIKKEQSCFLYTINDNVKEIENLKLENSTLKNDFIKAEIFSLNQKLSNLTNQTNDLFQILPDFFSKTSISLKTVLNKNSELQETIEKNADTKEKIFDIISELSNKIEKIPFDFQLLKEEQSKTNLEKEILNKKLKEYEIENKKLSKENHRLVKKNEFLSIANSKKSKILKESTQKLNLAMQDIDALHNAINIITKENTENFLKKEILTKENYKLSYIKREYESCFEEINKKKKEILSELSINIQSINKINRFSFENSLIRNLENKIKKIQVILQNVFLNFNFFDPEFYLSYYQDVKDANIDPLEHYIYFGIKEGRFKSEKDMEKFNHNLM